ncbi:MAG: hypothetical protein Q9167_005884 [Letrouitia subvulpina]
MNSPSNNSNQDDTSGLSTKELRRQAARGTPLTKSVVRHWVRRRIKTALREELRERGWGFDGFPLKELRMGSGDQSGGSTEVLKGTVEILATKEAARAGYGELKSDIGMMVEQMVQKMKFVDGSDAERMKETGYSDTHPFDPFYLVLDQTY